MKPQKQNKQLFSASPFSVSSLSVNPSALNPVKFELGIIIFVTLLFWAAVHISIVEPITQIVVLFLYSMLAAVWIVLRIKSIMKKLAREKTAGN